MKFRIVYCKDKIKIIEAKDLEDAEKKSPTSWIEIKMLEIPNRPIS